MEKEKKNKTIQVRLTSHEHEALTSYCALKSVNLSEVARKTLLENLKIKEKEKEKSEELRLFTLEVNRIGVNFNQIARKVNAGHISTSDELEEALNLFSFKLEELLKNVNKICK